MQFKHAPAAVSVSFDDPNLVSAAGLVPVMRLAEQAGLRELANTWLSVPSDKGANAGLKVTSLVGGMVGAARCGERNGGGTCRGDDRVCRTRGAGALSPLGHRARRPPMLVAGSRDGRGRYRGL